MSLTIIVCQCDYSFLDNFTEFLKKTSNKMRYAVVLQRVAWFFTEAAWRVQSKRRCLCEYFDTSYASYDSWKNMLKELHGLTKYLRDGKFQDLEILYENPTEINGMKVCDIYSTIMTMIVNIIILSRAFLKETRECEREDYPRTYILFNQYISLIKENMLMISVRHRSIALEKYFKGSERSRVINRLSNSFGLF